VFTNQGVLIIGSFFPTLLVPDLLSWGGESYSKLVMHRLFKHADPTPRIIAAADWTMEDIIVI